MPAARWLRTALPIALTLLISACATAPRRESGHVAPPPGIDSIPDATPRAEPRSAHGNPPFYEVYGRRYQVLASASGYVERGVASWYGPDFHGHSTSSGEPYDMYAMTAAHKTLPLPCYARVTNLANGRSVIVRINDRGPFVANRIVDLSYTAATRLDIVRTGTAFVELQTVGPGTGLGVEPTAAPTPTPTLTPTLATTGPAVGVQPERIEAPPVVATVHADPSQPTTAAPVTTVALYIQVGAYADEGNAQRVLERLQAAGVSPVFSAATSGPRRLHRVRVGPINTVEDFDQLASRLATLGFPDARLATD